jgi:hypothetical protein
VNQAAIAPARIETDPDRFFWYGVWALIMVASALPMLGIVRIPRLFGYTTTLIIHELAAFLYFGHTFFSNIWSLLIRRTQPPAVGIWARALLRKLCLGVTAPTAVITPLFGVMLLEDWGGLISVPWAWDAYFAFWLMAGFSIVPDVIRYGRNRNAADAMHGMLSGGIRGMLALVAVLYILLYCMIAKGSLFAGPILRALGIDGPGLVG